MAIPQTWSKPILSNGAGVHPSQAKAEMARAKKHGIDVSFTKDGRAVFESRSQRKKYCRFINLHDRDGGYGDP
jgi:TPP-dependent trihydroxycyclohexane-1,2-dione (THcHDO) dehydratase